jgi:hypothetical protein
VVVALQGGIEADQRRAEANFSTDESPLLVDLAAALFGVRRYRRLWTRPSTRRRAYKVQRLENLENLERLDYLVVGDQNSQRIKVIKDINNIKRKLIQRLTG